MIKYFQGVFREFRFIRWLSLPRAAFLTVLVVIATLIAGFLLGGVDNLFSSLLQEFVIGYGR